MKAVRLLFVFLCSYFTSFLLYADLAELNKEIKNFETSLKSFDETLSFFAQQQVISDILKKFDFQTLNKIQQLPEETRNILFSMTPEEIENWIKTYKESGTPPPIPKPAPPPPPPPSDVPSPPPPPPPTGGPTSSTKKPKLIPPLTQQELQKLTAEEKRKSDLLLLNVIHESAQYEFINYNAALKFINRNLNVLRSNVDFKLQKELSDFINDLSKNAFNLKQQVTGSNNNNDPIKIMKDSLIKAFFDKNLFDETVDLDIQIIIISIVSSQRTQVDIKSLTEKNAQESDELFKITLQDFQTKIHNNSTKGFTLLVKELNKLRINLKFLKYTDMLKDLKVAGKRDLLKEPIINLLRDPKNTKIGTLKAIFKNYVFEKEIIDTIFDNNSMQQALDVQFAKAQATREKVKPALGDFLQAELQKFQGVAGLEKVIEKLIQDYNQTDLGELQNELKKPVPDISIIITALQEVSQQNFPQSLIERIKNQIEQGIENKKIIDAIEKALKLKKGNRWAVLSNELKQSFNEPRSERIEKIINAIEKNFFVTPRDLWTIFGRQLNLALSDQVFDAGGFTRTFSSLGMLFLVFQHFIDELNRNANFKQAIQTLSESIRALNTGSINAQTVIGAEKTIDAWRKGDKTNPMDVPLAPVIVDRNLDGSPLSPGYYSSQIKAEILNGKLTNLQGAINKKMIAEIISALNILAEKDEYNVNPKAYEEFRNNIEKILTENIGGSA